MEIAIMIEGQNGLNWPRWQRIVRAVEEIGFTGLYRSDHFTNGSPPDKDSLELWVSLTWLADNSERIEFGPLVSPVSFRQPVMTARMALAVDDLSGGRLTLGMGAGWQEREHQNYGWDLLDVKSRLDRLEEGLQVVTLLMRSDEPVSYHGQYYTLDQAILLPRPQRPGGPPLLIGGNGERRTLPLAAKYADEWNGVFLTPQQVAELNSLLDDLLISNNRQPDDLRRSLMTGLVFGRTEEEFQESLRYTSTLFGEESPEELRNWGMIVGMPEEIKEQIQRYQEAGIQRLMLQWLNLDDIVGLRALGQVLL